MAQPSIVHRFADVAAARPEQPAIIGETHEVREFCDLAFSRVGLDYRDHVTQDERFMRPAEVDLLVGDAALARAELGWEPRVGFTELVRMMVDADLDRLRPFGQASAASR